MIIILEGADLVGKTSIAKKLHQITGFPQTSIWIDLNKPKPAVISVSKTIRLIIDALKPDIIFDRSFMSEYVYGNVLGRDISYIPELVHDWKHIKNCFLFIITANEDTLRKRYQQRGDSYVDINNIIEINEQYKKLHFLTEEFIPTFYVDSSDKNVETLAKEIMDTIELHKR